MSTRGKSKAAGGSSSSAGAGAAASKATKSSVKPNSASAPITQTIGSSIRTGTSVPQLGLSVLVAAGYSPLPAETGRTSMSTGSNNKKSAPQRMPKLSASSAMAVPLHEHSNRWMSRSSGCSAIRSAKTLIPSLTSSAAESTDAKEMKQDEAANLDVEKLLKMRNFVLGVVNFPVEKATAHDVSILRALLAGAMNLDRSGAFDTSDSSAASAAVSSSVAERKDRENLFAAVKRQVTDVMDPFLKKHRILNEEESEED